MINFPVIRLFTQGFHNFARQYINAALIDFVKAYDSVWHKRLIHKLHCLIITY